tara:strand:- start:443 stop:556 length:114 start_codon:yes stop_codon:yes gene_type:complete
MKTTQSVLVGEIEEDNFVEHFIFINFFINVVGAIVVE